MVQIISIEVDRRIDAYGGHFYKGNCVHAGRVRKHQLEAAQFFAVLPSLDELGVAYHVEALTDFI